jgi:hypothetical protein
MTGLDQLRSADRFGAWFCSITLNMARRWLRQMRAEAAVRLPDQPTAEPGPQEHAELAELAATVRAAVAQLAAGGGRVTEVRITRLTEATYYAAIMIDGPAGLARLPDRY